MSETPKTCRLDDTQTLVLRGPAGQIILSVAGDVPCIQIYGKRGDAIPMASLYIQSNVLGEAFPFLSMSSDASDGSVYPDLVISCEPRATIRMATKGGEPIIRDLESVMTAIAAKEQA